MGQHLHSPYSYREGNGDPRGVPLGVKSGAMPPMTPLVSGASPQSCWVTKEANQILSVKVQGHKGLERLGYTAGGLGWATSGGPRSTSALAVLVEAREKALRHWGRGDTRLRHATPSPAPGMGGIQCSG